MSNAECRCDHSKDAVLQLALVNPVSGSQQGKEFTTWFQQLLGKDRVHSIYSEQQVRNVLETTISCGCWKVLVAGGDGTCNLVVQILQSFPWKVCMIHIPIGTGNELARSLGWGGSCHTLTELQRLVAYVGVANIEALDIWNVSVQQTSSSARTNCMMGFLSLGIDAQVELRFNESRWRNPSSYQSSWLNIAKYGWYGLQTMLQWTRIAGILDFIESLEVDNVPLNIPLQIQSIIFLNLPCYGAGAYPIKPDSSSQVT